jgi:sugar/nucleoside kinase (ribokinase family)
MSKVLVIGGVSYNTMIYVRDFPDPRPQTVFSRGFHETVGSTGAGKSLNLVKLGLVVTLYGLIGDDRFGRQIKSYLQGSGVTFIHDIDPQGTKRHVNIMNSEGDRISIFLEAGTPRPRLNRRRIEDRLAECDYVVLNIVDYGRTLIRLIRRYNREIWCDLHDYDGHNPYHQDFIQAASHVFLSSDALPNYRPVMKQLLDQGKMLVVCTHGKDGATALTAAGQWLEVPGLTAYRPVDSNGAGDAFFAGVLFGHAKQYDIETCLKIGAIVGGLAVTSAELALPALSEAMVLEEYAKHFGQSPLRADEE